MGTNHGFAYCLRALRAQPSRRRWTNRLACSCRFPEWSRTCPAPLLGEHGSFVVLQQVATSEAYLLSAAHHNTLRLSLPLKKFLLGLFSQCKPGAEHEQQCAAFVPCHYAVPRRGLHNSVAPFCKSGDTSSVFAKKGYFNDEAVSP